MGRTKHEVGTVLTVKVPCQFGPDGKHFATVVMSTEDVVIGFRSECDALPASIEETGAALAGKHHRCCREVARVMIRELCKGRAYASDEARRVLGHHSLFAQMLDKTLPGSRSRGDKRRFAAPVPSWKPFSFTDRMTNELREMVELPSLTIAVEARDSKLRLVLRNHQEILATYRGSGVWQTIPRWSHVIARTCAEYADDGNPERCVVCQTKELKNVSAHRRAPMHAKRVVTAIEEYLAAAAAAGFSRARAHRAG